MQIATWIAVVILGPGVLALFAWFLVDACRLFKRQASARNSYQPSSSVEPPSKGE